jgi:hypothetical protein
MKTTLLAAAVLSAGLTCISLPAEARSDHHWRGGAHNRNWDASRSYDRRGYRHERRLTRRDYVYRGRDGRYYCRRSDGTTGLVVGGVGGALIGHAIGGDTLGTLLGAAGGAALGREIDRGQARCR